MRLSIERLRWGLLAAALLLIAVIVSLLAYGRYRAVRAWRQIVAHSGATVTHEAHEVTYSQAVGGRTVFTIHAADAMPHGDGKYILRNVELLLYGRNGTRVDRIYGSEFDYDQKNEIARALGEVHMDLQAPAALSSGARDEHSAKPQNDVGTQEVAETPDTIHVRTSGLVYMRNIGVASTDQEVEIAYQGFHGYAKGAEFNSDESTVHLLADVRVEAPVRGQTMQLTAMRADLERDSNVIRLLQPRVRSGSGSDERDGSASQATLHLRKDGSLQV
ncbi:MAG TPA: LPS export ABC transporter periplasmic protein LptC, partial [Acidobacteriaceae bacterium]|nr:LPS export ABC transporter periplasmic protein LptC [Acidobacteriaceae bacterium]